MAPLLAYMIARGQEEWEPSNRPSLGISSRGRPAKHAQKLVRANIRQGIRVLAMDWVAYYNEKIAKNRAIANVRGPDQLLGRKVRTRS